MPGQCARRCQYTVTSPFGLIQTCNSAPSGDGPLAGKRLGTGGLTSDRASTLFVGDGNSVKKIDLTLGTITTVFGGGLGNSIVREGSLSTGRINLVSALDWVGQGKVVEFDNREAVVSLILGL